MAWREGGGVRAWGAGEPGGLVVVCDCLWLFVAGFARMAPISLLWPRRPCLGLFDVSSLRDSRHVSTLFFWPWGGSGCTVMLFPNLEAWTLTRLLVGFACFLYQFPILATAFVNNRVLPSSISPRCLGHVVQTNTENNRKEPIEVDLQGKRMLCLLATGRPHLLRTHCGLHSETLKRETAPVKELLSLFASTLPQ